MSHEYKQVKYRAPEGRFDGSLNKMAGQGWIVESIDRVDDVFLVTYSRRIQPEITTVVCDEHQLAGVLRKYRDHEILSVTPVGNVHAGSTVYGSNEIRTEVRFAVVIALAPRMEVVARQLARDGQI